MAFSVTSPEIIDEKEPEILVVCTIFGVILELCSRPTIKIKVCLAHNVIVNEAILRSRKVVVSITNFPAQAKDVPDEVGKLG